MRHDEEAALHVVEALLAGMIILTAVLFMTHLGKPSPTAFQSGIDLERVSVDTLRILENRPAEDSCDDAGPPDPCYPSRLEEMVSHTMGFGVADAVDQDGKAQTAETFLRQVIPVGNRWLLRLDNGEEPLVLLPATGSNVELTPRGAKAAETFILPQWQGLADATACDSDSNLPPATVHVPGGTGWGGVAAGGALHAPTGSAIAPVGYATWEAWWNDHVVDTAGQPAPYTDRVPKEALYGWWWHDANADDAVDAGECHFVGLPDSTATDYAAYGVQLVVWPIAG